MADAWRCECGYTNLGSKACLVCRRPRQAVPPPAPDWVDEPAAAPPAASAPAKKARKRPVKAPAAKKAATRKRAR